MKKILCLITAVLILLSFAACSALSDDMYLPVETASPNAAEERREPEKDVAEEKKDETVTDEPVIDDPVPSEEPAEEQKDEPVSEEETEKSEIDENGVYTSKEDVALYIHTYGKLPGNFITKKKAQKLGWQGGSLEPYAPGMCIGGTYFGNYEGALPEKEGREYRECDIDTLGKSKRGAKRIIYSNDGLIYYTDDHYETFELLYGDENA